ncbi:flagellar basal-body MS-ring/collar protein FliF [Eubacteriaceae bacterium ES3]|nr:flagellar basal-body MS-ring/collar protein FliF [Eubacteriaceae bacterium ES3]
MPEQIKKVLDNLKEFWGKFSKKMKIVIIAVAATVLIGSLVLTLVLNQSEYVPLFSDLTDTETTEIMAALQDLGVEVKLEDGQIMVLSDQEATVRMQLAQEGYPKSGLSYYLIQENSSLLSTDYERQQYKNLQLQERIAASIRTITGVSDAVVTLSIPDENVFYLQETEPTTASVIIHLEQGVTLSEDQILGIQNLIAKSVSGLEKEDIALTDGNGNDLVATAESNSGASSKIALTREIEQNLTAKVNNVLNGPYDPSQYKVSVTANLNTDSVKQESVVYTPSEDGDNSGVLNQESSSFTIDGGTLVDGGVAGTTGNTDTTTYAEEILGEGGLVSGFTNDNYYSVSSEVTQTERTDPTVDAVSIAVAIDAADMNAVERENLTQLIAFAAGVNPENVTIRNFDFYSAEDDTATTDDQSTGADLGQILIIAGIAGALLLVVVILLIVLLGRRRKKKAQEALDHVIPSLEDEGIFEETVPSIPVRDIKPVVDDKREKVKEFATANPEIVAQLVKSWLKNENE